MLTMKTVLDRKIKKMGLEKKTKYLTVPDN